MKSEPPVELLLVEDSPDDAGLIQAQLRRSLTCSRITSVSRLSDALRSAREFPPDVILLDLNLPDSHGVDTFDQLTAAVNGVPIVVLSGMEDLRLAVSAVSAGAQDYVLKGSLDGDTLARSVRFAIERSSRIRAERDAIRYRSELKAAQRIQDSLYPSGPPEIPGVDLAGGVRSAGIGCGDYYDFLPLADGRLLIVVGDVSGHGMGAAIIMAEIRACLRTLADFDAPPERIMGALNRLICHSSSNSMFVTLLMAVFDAGDQTLRYYNAGHTGWVMRQQGGDEQLTTHEIPLGLIPDRDYSRSSTLRLISGDVLVIPTDGIYESPSATGGLFGIPGMLRTLRNNSHRSAAEMVEELFRTAEEFRHSDRRHDDMTAAILKMR